MSHSCRSHGLGFVVACVLAATHAYAQGPLRIELTTVTSNIRSHAPLLLDVSLEWMSTGLLEGRLELTCYDRGKLINRYRSGELVLSDSERRFRTVLPPMPLAEDLSLLAVKARFVSDSSSYDLGKFELRAPVHWKRSFVIAVVRPEGHAHAAGVDFGNGHVFASGGVDFGNSLRLDQFQANELRRSGLLSIPSRIAPSDLPTGGLGCFSFDLLVLTGPGFSELRASQLDVIGDWVEAGGSLFVVVDRTTPIAQAKFLNRIAGLPQNDPALLMNTDSRRPEKANESPAEFHKYRPGLGRAVVLRTPPDADTMDASAELRELVAFLWKLRSDKLSELQETGTWETPPEPSSPSQIGRSYKSYPPHKPYEQVRLAEADGLATILLPEKVQGMPFGVVVAVLVLFLIVIVPVDYYFLGYLKRRKYTWVLLPIVSLGFTLFTAGLGNAYLGSADYRTSLEFVDLTEGDRVIRSSRIELLFTAAQREVTTSLKQTLYTPIPARRARDENERNSSRTGMTYGNTFATQGEIGRPQEHELPIFEGNMPASFSIRQQMRKWSPQLSRQTALSTERPVPQFDLDQIDTKLLQTSDFLANPAWQQGLCERIHSSMPKSTVLIFNGDQAYDLTHGTELLSRDELSLPAANKDTQLLGLVRKVCVRPADRLFSIVSQISPNGAADLEDLSILDPSDADQWLLVIVATQGNDYVVFRRLFRGDW